MAEAHTNCDRCTKRIRVILTVSVAPGVVWCVDCSSSTPWPRAA